MHLLLKCHFLWWRSVLLLLFFVGGCAFHLSAQSITLSVKNEKLEIVMRLLEQQSPIHFLYTTEHLKKALPVTLEITKVTLDEALVRCFAAQPLNYQREGKQVIISAGPLKLPSGERELKGHVIDENGEGLPGITVRVANTSLSAPTALDGSFVLTGVPEQFTLIVTGAEIEKQQIVVRDLRKITIRTQRITGLLEETVVKGYYTTSRKLNTGTVSTLTAKQITTQPVANPLAALQGRLPGLFITQYTGLPGAQFSVQIRGRNSIQSGNEPLYVVDGVIYGSDNLTQSSFHQVNNAFSTLVPDDIDRIEVLKDADATALYGSRGANGVILITTKKGKAGRTKVEVNIGNGIGRPTGFVNYLSRDQYLAMRHEAFSNDNVTPTRADAGDLFIFDTTRQTNWKNQLIGKSADQLNTQIRVSGGSERNTFSVSGNYYKEQTVFGGDFGNQRFAMSTALGTSTANKRWTADFTSIIGQETNHLPVNDPVQSLTLIPHAPYPFNPDGTFNWGEPGWSYLNPEALKRQTYHSTVLRLNNSATIIGRLAEGLNFRMNGGMN